jgi:hypothetical protein
MWRRKGSLRYVKTHAPPLRGPWAPFVILSGDVLDNQAVCGSRRRTACRRALTPCAEIPAQQRRAPKLNRKIQARIWAWNF